VHCSIIAISRVIFRKMLESLIDTLLLKVASELQNLKNALSGQKANENREVRGKLVGIPSSQIPVVAIAAFEYNLYVFL